MLREICSILKIGKLSGQVEVAEGPALIDFIRS